MSASATANPMTSSPVAGVSPVASSVAVLRIESGYHANNVSASYGSRSAIEIARITIHHKTSGTVHRAICRAE